MLEEDNDGDKVYEDIYLYKEASPMHFGMFKKNTNGTVTPVSPAALETHLNCLNEEFGAYDGTPWEIIHHSIQEGRAATNATNGITNSCTHISEPARDARGSRKW
jgi:hypothetical protein